MLLCNQGCDWRALGDGVFNPQCNTSACFWDLQDCAAGATGCTADCHPDWIVTARESNSGDYRRLQAGCTLVTYGSHAVTCDHTRLRAAPLEQQPLAGPHVTACNRM